MAHKIFTLDLKASRLFLRPRLDFKRVLEAIAVPICYIILFYNLWQLAQAYLPGSNLVDVRIALLLSILAVFRSIFKESVVSPFAGLTSLGLMFNFLYGSGCLTRFGVIQMHTEAITVRIKFVNLLMIILVVLTFKALQYIYELIKKFRG